MPRTRVQRVGPESVSLQAVVPWCSSCNGLILRNGEVTWRSELLQRLQEVRGNCKTRNQLICNSERSRLGRCASPTGRNGRSGSVPVTGETSRRHRINTRVSVPPHPCEGHHSF